MASFEDLLAAYRRHLQLPWASDLSDAERTWVLWYDPVLQRRVAGHAMEFERATHEAGHGWKHVDLSSLLVSWLTKNRHAARLMRRPNEIAGLATDMLSRLAETVAAEAGALTERDMLALFGVGALFGLASVVSMIEALAPSVRGRLLVAFPGRYEAGRYRLLDARDS